MEAKEMSLKALEYLGLIPSRSLKAESDALLETAKDAALRISVKQARKKENGHGD